MYNCAKKYSGIRGFNFQPDWGGHGITVWLRFNEKRYRELLLIGRDRFPKMNTVRIWLSFDAWYDNRKSYLDNLKKAGEIITSEDIHIIPVYFNGWHSLPDFGGFTPEIIHDKSRAKVYMNYLKDCVQMLALSDILMHDLSNEPLNNIHGSPDAAGMVYEFLECARNELSKCDSREITIGTQGYLGLTYSNGKKWSDIDLFDPIVDVHSLHPYNIKCEPKEIFKERTVKILDHIEALGKSVIITECCWAGNTDEDRLPYLETELTTYSELNMGFCCHALNVSPVADLHPLEGSTNPENGLYMAFLDRKGNIRKGHELFNMV